MEVVGALEWITVISHRGGNASWVIVEKAVSVVGSFSLKVPTEYSKVGGRSNGNIA